MCILHFWCRRVPIYCYLMNLAVRITTARWQEMEYNHKISLNAMPLTAGVASVHIFFEVRLHPLGEPIWGFESSLQFGPTMASN